MDSIHSGNWAAPNLQNKKDEELLREPSEILDEMQAVDAEMIKLLENLKCN